MNAKLLLTISTWTGVLPLLTGSLIFWIWFFYPSYHLEDWGVYTIIVAFPICIIGLMLANKVLSKNKSDRELRKAKLNIYLNLLNIPFCFGYLWFASYLLDTERITIINNTGNGITDIYIFGVGDRDLINSLEKGDSKTVWVHMTHEGGIEMTFKENGQVKKIFLTGYTGPGMGGHRFDYFIEPEEENYGSKP